jgi:hypothetical protein
MIKRSVAASAVLSAASLMALLTLASPASAGSCGLNGCNQGGGPGGPVSVASCNPADATCFAGEYGLISLSGDKSDSGFDYVNLPPPPCLWSPLGGAETGSEVILGLGREVDHMTPSPQQIQLLKELGPVLGQAGDLLEQALSKPPGPPGTWYQIQPNPAVSAAESASCGQGVIFVWVPPGAALPGLPALPAIDLADYALDHMALPKPEVVTSPATKGYVNFATYVWTNWPDGVTGSRAREVTATLGDESVTVWGQPTVSINVNGPGTAYTDCSVYGTSAKLGHAPAYNAGVPPDCGALWTATDADATVGATITWTVTWYHGGPDGPAGAHLATIPTHGQSGPLPINAIEATN